MTCQIQPGCDEAMHWEIEGQWDPSTDPSAYVHLDCCHWSRPACEVSDEGTNADFLGHMLPRLLQLPQQLQHSLATQRVSNQHVWDAPGQLSSAPDCSRSPAEAWMLCGGWNPLHFRGGAMIPLIHHYHLPWPAPG